MTGTKMTNASGFLYLYIILVIHATYTTCIKDDETNFIFYIKMPSVQPDGADQYYCTSKEVIYDEAYIVGFEPQANASRAHHMILFGTSNLGDVSEIYPNYWDCGHIAGQKGLSILFAWARNAPPVNLPQDVGFVVGRKTSITRLILQVHYSSILPAGTQDTSGLRLKITTNKQRYTAGIFILANSRAVIPPRKPKVKIDVSCPYLGARPIYTFAYRVHTHKLGVVVTGYKYDHGTDSFTLLAKGNPQWPQAFFPMDQIHIVSQNDTLLARCTYNSTNRDRSTIMGASSNDEMCNLYLMYYSEGAKLDASCNGDIFPSFANMLPNGNDIPLPKNKLLEELGEEGQYSGENPDLPLNYPNLPSQINITKKTSAHHNLVDMDYDDLQKAESQKPELDPNFNYTEVSNWPKEDRRFGQVTAVTFDSKGNVVVFHRGSHVWNGQSFDFYDNYLPINDGPITEDTIVTIDPLTGHVLKSWGAGLFYLPHGLTIDKKGVAWLTDVALHQVFKFPENGAAVAEVTLGTRFVNGNDKTHFCKPASVAISEDGDIFVADGYCNTRIVRFTSDGRYVSQFGENNAARTYPPPPNTFYIPHKVILVQKEKYICVADREHGRVQCFTKSDGKFSFQIHRDEFHGRLFAIASTDVNGGILYAVSGNSLVPDNYPVQAFAFNLTSKAMLNIITPRTGTFSQPHDIAVSENSDDVYVVEIGPDKIWKFEKTINTTHRSTKKVLIVSTENQPTERATETAPTEQVPHYHAIPSKPLTSSTVMADASNFATSMVIMALLGIPVLLLILITVIFRLKKRGKFQHCTLPHVKGWLGGYRSPHSSQEKFNIGSLLNPHKGFDRVALDESDLDGEDKSDSDIEEFNAAIRKA